MALRLVPEAPPGMLIVRLVGHPNSAPSAFGHTTEVLHTSWAQEQVSQ